MASVDLCGCENVSADGKHDGILADCFFLFFIFFLTSLILASVSNGRVLRYGYRISLHVDWVKAGLD